MSETVNPIQLGSLLLDIDANQLRNNEQQQQIEPKLVEVIKYLHQHKNQVVPRNELQQKVWNGQIVSDNAISRSISQIRKLLELSESPAPVIETIPRVGYRLIITEEIASDPQGEQQNSVSAPKSTRHLFSIAMVILLAIMLFIGYQYQKSDLEVSFDDVSISTLTQLPGKERGARFSPDGQTIAFVYTAKGAAGDDIYLLDLKTQKATPLIESSSLIISMVWSPDSKSILFSQWNNRHQRECSIKLIKLSEDNNLLSNQVINQCNQRSAVNLAWNKSGDKFYFNERKSIDRPYSIYSYSLTSKRVSQITLPSQSGNLRGDFFLTGNLSGTRLAVIRYLSTSKRQLTIYDTDNEQILSQQTLGNNLSAIAWFGQQEKLLALIDDKLYKMNVDGSQQQRLYSIGDQVGGISMNSQENKIVFSSGRADANIVAFQIDPTQQNNTQLAQLSVSSSIETMPSYAHQTNQLAYLSYQSGKLQIWLVDESGQRRQLSSTTLPLVPTPLHWSPDDKTILLQVDDEIYTISVDNGVMTKQIDLTHKPYVASWSHSGESIYYSSEKTGDWQIWKFDIDKKQHQQITQNGGYSAYEHATGDIFFSKLHEPGLWRISVDKNSTATVEKIISQFPVENWINWKLASDGIYYVDVQQQKKGIYFYDLAENASRLVFQLKPNHAPYYSIKNDVIALVFIEDTDRYIQLLEAN